MARTRLTLLLASGPLTGAVAGTGAPPPAANQTAHPCAMPSWKASDASCTPFANVGVKFLAAFPSGAFGRDTTPRHIVTLDNGSVIVQTDRDGLYRIAGGRVRGLLPSNPRCGDASHFRFDLVGSFDDAVLVSVHHYRRNSPHITRQLNGLMVQEPLITALADTTAALREDGSVAFQLPFSYASVAEDAGGVVWLFKAGPSDRTVYAYLPRTARMMSVEAPDDIVSMFRSPNGHVYVSNFDGLYELDAQPTAHARMVHGPLETFGESAGSIQAVGADGSLWATTPTDVIHLRPNGTRRVMHLTSPTNMEVSSAMTPPISLTMSPDGAVWNTGSNVVRIGNDDRVAVWHLPPSEQRGDLKFAPDSSLWVVANDAGVAQSLGIVHVVPAAAPRRSPAWPFKSLPTTSPPELMFCPPPTPPPTPTPPLPPKTGAVDFVYAADTRAGDIWGYWADANGKLTHVRGAPFVTHSDPTGLAISPDGRYLFVGSSYDGINVYAIDSSSGSLRLAPGSPFGKETIGPDSIIFDRSGRFVYVANLDGKNLSGYAVDRDNGALRALPWAPLALKHWPFRLVRNPRRDIAYFFTENGQLETFSTRNGIRPQLSSVAFPRGLGGNLLVDPLARWLYAAGSWGKTVTVYGMDPRTGGLTPSSTSAFAFPNGPRAMVSDSRGRFLYVNTVRDRKEAAAVLGYRIDARKGALRPLPSWPYGGATGGNGLTITPDDRFLYATNFDSKSVAGFAVDRRTGAFRLIGGSPFKAGDTPDDIVSCIRASNACVPAP